MARNVIIKFRRATAARWTAENPILDEGEPGIEINTGRLKVGDGVTRWQDLKYFNPEDSADNSTLPAHVNSLTPHPVYDDGPALDLLYENAKV